MSEVRLSAELRTDFGKGAARRTRRAGRIPAVLYGHGEATTHLSLDAREYARVLKQGYNTLITIEVAGAKKLALTKALQRDPLKLTIDHVDLLIVKRGEKVQVEVPVHLVGEAVRDSLINHELTTLSVEAEATHLPEAFEVSIEGLAVGAHILAQDVELPRGSTLMTDPEAIVVGVIPAPTAAQMEAEAVPPVAAELPAEEAETQDTAEKV